MSTQNTHNIARIDKLGQREQLNWWGRIATRLALWLHGLKADTPTRRMNQVSSIGMGQDEYAAGWFLA